MWQMGGVGPMFGQVGFFNKFAGKAYEDKRPRDRYATESARLLGVSTNGSRAADWLMGADYSIADISLLGWVRNLIGFLRSARARRLRRFLHVQRGSTVASRVRGGSAGWKWRRFKESLLEVEIDVARVIRERTRRRGFWLLANELARRESLDPT